MSKFPIKIALLGFVAALALPAAAPAQGEARTNPAPRFPTNAVPLPGSPIRMLPLHGTVAAVNTDAQTLTIGDSVLHVTPKTRIAKAGKPATLTDIKVGDVANVSYHKAADGTMEAVGIHIVARPPVKARQLEGVTPSAPAPASPGANN